MTSDILVVGAGGHCRVVLSILFHYKEFNIIGIADRNNESIGEEILGIKVKYSWNDFSKLYNKGVNNAVLAVGDNVERKKLFQELISIGFSIKSIIHPSSIVSESANISDGTTICMGAKIGPLVSILENCIVYSGSIIEHETIIEKNSFVAPGVSIAGRVKIESSSFIGIGCSIKEGIKIGKNSIIGAGSVVINDIKSNSTVVGVPAKYIKN